MRLIFVGGVFTPELTEEILFNSRGNIQNAADIFQKNLILGFSKDERIKEKVIINLPFIGSYPTLYTKVYFSPTVNEENFFGFFVRNTRFFNFIGLKNISRTYSVFKELFSILRSKKEINCNDIGQVVICYSMHLPFLIACILVKLFVPKFKLVVVVPDLPEYMASRTGVSYYFYSSMSKLTYFLANKADLLVLLTKQMISRFSINPQKIIVEGIIDESLLTKSVYLGRSNYFLYTGTLDYRYGIKELVDSFVNANFKDLNLIICGHGEASDYVQKISKRHSNIIFKGLVNRDESIELQFNAKFLVNPRRNNSEFTKYSFPSKIMEYFVTGVPVVMFKLDGIPNEYDDLFFRIPDDVIDYSEYLNYLNSIDDKYLKDFGLNARSYVILHKGPLSQAKLIIDSL